MSDHPRGAEPEQDDVGILLRLAGKRVPVPVDRTERVRHAARDAWRKEIAGRARRRWAWTAAAVAAAALGLALLARWRSDVPVPPAVPVLAGPPARVESVVGEVRDLAAAGAAAPVRLVSGDEVRWGSELEALERGSVALRFPSGHVLRVGDATTARLSDEREIVLRRGRVYVDSGSGGERGPAVSVRTPFGDVSEIGTRFEVHVDDAAMRVRMRDGRALVNAAGRKEEIEAGTELRIDADGGATRRTIASYGPGWDWLLAVTTVPNFDGQPASALLEWAARERGWSLSYEDAATRRSAQTNVLRGAFDRLSIDEALEVATLASRLVFRIDGGVLHVASVPPPSTGDR